MRERFISNLVCLSYYHDDARVFDVLNISADFQTSVDVRVLCRTGFGCKRFSDFYTQQSLRGGHLFGSYRPYDVREGIPLYVSCDTHARFHSHLFLHLSACKYRGKQLDNNKFHRLTEFNVIYVCLRSAVD